MIEEIVQKLTEHLYSGSKEFLYKGHRFIIEENTYPPNPINFCSMVYIYIKVPIYIGSRFHDVYSISYEKKQGSPRQEHFLRIEACARLAREFITVALPKIDYEIEKELHNRKIEEILDVLE